MRLRIQISNILFDVLIVVVSFACISFFKNEPYDSIIQKYYFYFFVFIFIFVSVSLAFGKYVKKRLLKHTEISKRYFFSWATSSLISLSLIYILQTDYNSRFIMLGTLAFLIFLEFIWLFLYYSIRYAVNYDSNVEDIHRKRIDESIKNQAGLITPTDDYAEAKVHEIEIIQELFGKPTLDFIAKHINIFSIHTEYFYTSFTFSILAKQHASHSFVNFLRLNDVRRINKLIESVYTKLDDDGVFICCAETNGTCKKRYLEKYPYFWGYIKYTFDFLFRRVWPKIPYINQLYFGITKGQNRALSHAEILGRLFSCGFDLIDTTIIDSLSWYAVKKTHKPILNSNPTYGPLIKLKRVGKNQKIINVYKLRTMHPFSEFLQQYIYEQNYLDEKSKFKDDFRITTIGKIMRKLWIDEFPMIINVFKGELKIVGVRPLSQQYFNLYPEDMRQLRTKFKPGLVPPYYVDLPKNFNQVVESERKYLISYEKSPFLTDIKYFFKAFYNIFFHKARSK